MKPCAPQLRPPAAEVRQYLGEDERKLYDLIWKRAVASQMEAAIMEQVASTPPRTGTPCCAPMAGGGIRRLPETVSGRPGRTRRNDQRRRSRPQRPRPHPAADFRRGCDDPRSGDAGTAFHQAAAAIYRSQPCPQDEELGIGRPSTYASILQVLQDRNYVVLEQRRFTPHDRGRMVVAFLAEFERHVEYGFTADLENSLDDVSNGDMEWKKRC